MLVEKIQVDYKLFNNSTENSTNKSKPSKHKKKPWKRVYE
jgi:hypothetical protein